MPTDSEMLDWLQSKTQGYGRGWIARHSTTGRGYRLHETSAEGANPDVRGAVKDAMKAESESREGDQ